MIISQLWNKNHHHIMMSNLVNPALLKHKKMKTYHKTKEIGRIRMELRKERERVQIRSNYSSKNSMEK